MKKALVLATSITLIVCFAIGGTLAWLSDKTDPLVNTFTVGNIDITLTETTTNYKMIPGDTIAKDPKVTVEKGSEDCWLFVKVEESTNLSQFISYELNDGWIKLNDTNGVYYRKVDATTEKSTEFNVIKNNKVLVKQSVTKEMMNEIISESSIKPTLTFSSYAVQYYKGQNSQGNKTFFTPIEAWNEVNNA